MVKIMKRFLVNWCKVLITVIVLVCFTLFSFTYLSDFFRYKDNGDEVDYIQSLPDDTLDVLFVGSSQAQYSIHPPFFYELTGLNSMVAGSGCQNLSVSYAIMQEVFETQQPQYVVLDVYTATHTSVDSCYADEMVYVGSQLVDDPYRADALQGIKDQGNDTYDNYYYDLGFTHDNWKNLELDTIINRLQSKQNPYEGSFGYVYMPFEYDYTYTPLMVYDPSAISEIEPLTKNYIDLMLDLCKKNNAELVLVKVPADIGEEDQALVRGVLDYGKQNGALTLNLIDKAEEIGWFLNRNGDTFHNNIKGAYKTTAAIADLLLEQSELVSKDESHSLASLYRDQVNEYAYYLTEKNDDIYENLLIADRLNLTTFLYYDAHSKSNMQSGDYAMLESIGFDISDISNLRSTYQLVDENGNVVATSDGSSPLSYEGIEITFTDTGFSLNGSNYDMHGDDFGVLFIDTQSYNASLSRVNTYEQDYFWVSQCYEQACNFEE